MILDHTKFALYGHITNLDNLKQSLGLTGDVAIQALLSAAFQAWKFDFNQKVLGDYALILPLTKGSSSSKEAHDSLRDKLANKDDQAECLITCSGFSSYRLFYQADETRFAVSASLDSFMSGAALEVNAIGQLMTQSYIVPPLTLVKGVRQLANGESQIWQISLGKASKNSLQKQTAQQADTDLQGSCVKAKCLAHKTLNLWEKLAGLPAQQTLEYQSDLTVGLDRAEQLAVNALKEADFNGFMAMPLLSRLLNEPVTQKRQLLMFEHLLHPAKQTSDSQVLEEFAGQVAKESEDDQEGHLASQQTSHPERQVSYVSYEGLRALGIGGSQSYLGSVAEQNQGWDKTALKAIKQHKALLKPLLRRRIRGAFKAQRHTQLALRQEYQTQMLAFNGKQDTGGSEYTVPSFELWLALSVRLPNLWQQERLLADRLGQKVNFICLSTDVIRQALSSNQADFNNYEQALPSLGAYEMSRYFSHEDDSLVSLYDAMQRLMMHGYKPVTQRLFNIAPPLSAKLIKHTEQQKQVDAFCMQSLTLDHLSRHLNCSLGSN